MELRLDRRWIRRDKPIALFWEGLLVLLAVVVLLAYALGYFAYYEIEASVRSETLAALNAQGFGWVQVEVSGQNVRLTGVQPVAHAGDEALAIAQGAACPTWSGRLICSMSVSGEFSGATTRVLAPISMVGPGKALVCQKSLKDVIGHSQIQFANGSAEMSASSGAVLDALASVAASCEGVIRIEGHTDSAGAASLNLALSTARADAVAAALAARGFPQSRLQVQGFGAQQPIADNATAAGRAANRRIEFRVFEKEIEPKGDES